MYNEISCVPFGLSGFGRPNAISVCASLLVTPYKSSHRLSLTDKTSGCHKYTLKELCCIGGFRRLDMNPGTSTAMNNGFLMGYH